MTTKKTPAAIGTGDIVKHFLKNDEYVVLDILSDGRLKVLNIKTGGRGEMPAAGAVYVRSDNTPAVQRKIAAWLERWEEQDNPRPSALVPGTVVTFKANDTRATAQMKKLGWDPKTLLVVIKNSPKSVTLVPLGGHGDGLAYMRAHSSLLETVEMKTTR